MLGVVQTEPCNWSRDGFVNTKQDLNKQSKQARNPYPLRISNISREKSRAASQTTAAAFLRSSHRLGDGFSARHRLSKLQGQQDRGLGEPDHPLHVTLDEPRAALLHRAATQGTQITTVTPPFPPSQRCTARSVPNGHAQQDKPQLKCPSKCLANPPRVLASVCRLSEVGW